jgi:hypothetical protein
MTRKLAFLLPVTLAAACATLKEPDSSQLSTYCTAETGYRVGYLAKAYYGGCPKESEAAFLAGVQRGRGYRPNPPQVQPYYERMEQTEKQLLAASADAERERLGRSCATRVVGDPHRQRSRELHDGIMTN